MPPEVMGSPSDADARSDLYALGAVGYYLLTGQHVFTGDGLLEICFAHVHATPVPPSERLEQSLPADLEAVILSCLEKAPSDRPQSAAALLSELTDCHDVAPWTQDKATAWWDEHQSKLPTVKGNHTDTSEFDETLARTVMFDYGEDRSSQSH